MDKKKINVAVDLSFVFFLHFSIGPHNEKVLLKNKNKKRAHNLIRRGEFSRKVNLLLSEKCLNVCAYTIKAQFGQVNIPTSLSKLRTQVNL